MAIFGVSTFTEYDQPVTPDGETRTGQDLDAAFFTALCQAVHDSAPRLTRLAVTATGNPPADGQVSRHDASGAGTSGLPVVLGNQAAGTLVGVNKYDAVSANPVIVYGLGGGSPVATLRLEDETAILVSLGAGAWQLIGRAQHLPALIAYLSGTFNTDTRAFYDGRYVKQADAVAPSAPPIFSGVQTTAQTLTTGTNTPITFTSEIVDSVSGHDITTNTSRFTCPANQGGWYLASACVMYASNATGLRGAFLRKNGATFIPGGGLLPASSAGAMRIPVAGQLVQLAATDYLELLGLQTSGGNLATDVPAEGGSHLTLVRVSN